MRKHIKPFLPEIYTIKEDSYIDIENDTYKQNKVRKTIRSTYLLIDTDNLGQV